MPAGEAAPGLLVGTEGGRGCGTALQAQGGTRAEYKVKSSDYERGCALTRLVVFQGTQRPQDPVKAGANRGADRGCSAEPGQMSAVRAEGTQQTPRVPLAPLWPGAARCSAAQCSPKPGLASAGV